MSQQPENASLVEVTGLKKYFSTGQGILRPRAEAVKAIDGISFSIKHRETFGLVGESGCGKSTTGRCILRLIEPTAGQVRFDGKDLLSFGREDLRRQRGHMQIIFQDPYSSLDPRMKVSDIIEEPLIVHRRGKRKEREETVNQLLLKVGLKPEHGIRYPHEFSGGQRQRIGIARALALSPKFIVCDEPVSALDVSVQAQVINLLQELQEELGLTYLFISHGLPVVQHLANRVAIMYRGRLVEAATAAEIFQKALHPYTQALLAAVPTPIPGQKHIKRDKAPDRSDTKTGCRFLPRCPISEPRCSREEPELIQVSPGHYVACFASA